ncbi:MAG: DUF1573 domain-containing protein [Candidatus Omnitrophica bacterium]|nr:DUF1573 domain-containing protein [Candidatus Omnitrophota bacterium]
MKKLIFFTLLVLLITTNVFAAPQIAVKEKTFELPLMAEGKVYGYSFVVQNSGDTELAVEPLRVDCGCVKIVEPSGSVKLAPKEKLTILFQFDTTGFTGPTVKYIFINTNDPKQPLLTIKLLADIRPEKAVILERFKSFSWLTIVTAGLIDGINPCAFTVLIFFISFLAFAGYNRKQTVILGLFFILAVFLTYLGLGLGLFEFLRRIAIFNLVSQIIYIVVAIFALILGAISLYDWWIFNKTKDAEKIKLKLPGIIKRKIQETIREKTDDRKDATKSRDLIRLAFTALSCGFIVSILESVCTGQLYLPTIVYIMKMPELKTKAWMYLMLYNLMFIVPLLIIFLFALWGVTSQVFAKLAQRHLAKIKLLTALLFFALGLFLLIIIR